MYDCRHQLILPQNSYSIFQTAQHRAQITRHNQPLSGRIQHTPAGIFLAKQSDEKYFAWILRNPTAVPIKKGGIAPLDVLKTLRLSH